MIILIIFTIIYSEERISKFSDTKNKSKVN